MIWSLLSSQARTECSKLRGRTGTFAARSNNGAEEGVAVISAAAAAQAAAISVAVAQQRIRLGMAEIAAAP